MLQDTHIYSRKIFYPALLLLLWLGQLASAQNPVIANAALAEKVYLQLDRNVYTTNETIWFKSILVSAANHMPNTFSGVLHVDLIGPNEQIVEKKLVAIENGIGNSFFELHDTYMKGKYMIRAYTQWNQNFENDFIFRTYVDVFPSSGTETEKVITQIKFSEPFSGEKRLTAQLNPQILDTLQREELKVFITVDNKRDTLTVKRNRNNTYPLDHIVQAGSKLVTIELETENGINHTRTIAPNEQLLDVQFMPESGELVHGLTNLVGIKVLDHRGKGRKSNGDIIDSKGKTISTFETNHLGMGSFYVRADSSNTYYARIPSVSTENSNRYPLPSVIPRGTILSVLQRNDLINLMVSSNFKEKDSVFIRASCRGVAHYIIKGQLNNGQAAFSLPDNSLPEGIIAFTLLNNEMKPIAERLFFNERPETRLNIEISTDKPAYHQRDKTVVDVKVTDWEGKTTAANLSLLVTHFPATSPAQHSENILSELLLNSEIRGEIEDAGYYFNTENQGRRKDLDVLLLTQGWRKYKYDKKPRDSLFFEPQITLSVAGTVGGIFSTNNMKEGIGVSLMTFGNSPSLNVQETDSLGRFYFPLGNERGQRLNILLQSTNKSGKNRNYTFSLAEHTPPSINYDLRQAIEAYDSLTTTFVQKQQDRDLLHDDLELSPEVNKLDEVVLDTYQMTPNRRKVMDAYGKPDSVIGGNAIQEKAHNWSYGLYSVLASNFPRDIRFTRIGGGGGYMKAEVVGGDETVILVDGIPIREDDFPLIPNIPTSEVKSVEIIRHVQNFHHLYRDVYPESSAIDTPVWGSIIAIYTHGGTGILAANKPVGVLKATVPVFSPRRQFYAPKYGKLSSRNRDIQDFRSTIHWEPQIRINDQNSYSTSFYNSDSTGDVFIIIEAISDDGKIGYEVLPYIVAED